MINNVRNHSVFRNASALGVVQIANYIVPLLLLPFLTRQLGVEAYGVVAIALAVIQFSFVITDYGFTLSATYAISINRSDTDYINKKIGSIFGAKAFLLTLVTLVLFLIFNILDDIESYSYFLFAVIIAVAAQTFQPIWLFQGIERMKKITIYTVVTKFIYAVFVLMLISDPGDAVLVVYCWGGAQFIGLVASLYFMRKEGYKIKIPDLLSIKNELKESAHFFWSRLAVSLYTSASVLIIGTQGAAQVAYYSVCEQIYKAGQNFTSPINNAMFPYMAKYKNWSFFYKIFTVMIFVITVGCIVLSFFSELLLGFVFGEEYIAATSVLLVFLCTTVVNYIAVTFGYSAFSALGRVKLANITVIAGAIIHSLVLMYLYFFLEINALNVALAVLFTETFVMLCRVTLFIKIKKLNVQR